MTPRAAPMSPDDRRRAIIDAVRPLLIEHGDQLTSRVIADAAGIAEGTIFRVFADKDALMHAVAADTLNPADGRENLLKALDGVIDLPAKVRITAELMLHRSDQVVAVMMALRRHWMATPHEHPGQADRLGPPQFVLDAHQALLERLIEVFEPHRDELSVTPERAALLLRTLVLGSRNPGVPPEDRLTADDVADVLLNGIHRPTPVGEPC
ncbi:MAG: TetR/AcrR family transcriptional regulator [Nocardioidaceae bacterium]